MGVGTGWGQGHGEGRGKNSRAAACQLFIVTEGSGSVVNGMKCWPQSDCLTFLNLSFPTAARRFSLPENGLLPFGFGLGKESPTLPSFSAEVSEGGGP